MKRWLCLLVLLFAVTGAQAQNLVASGSLTAAAASCVQSGTGCTILGITSGSTGSAVITLAGTWTATPQFEASNDAGVTWAAIAGTPLAGGAAVTTSAANGTWGFNVSALTHIRVRLSAFVSGSVSVTITGSVAAASSRGGSSGSGLPSGCVGTVGVITCTDFEGAIGNTTPNPGHFSTLNATGFVTFPAGTATNPSEALGFTSNGWFSVGNGVVALSGAGTEVVRVGSTFALEQGLPLIFAPGAAGTQDVGLSRIAAATLAVGTQTAGDTTGTLQMTATTLLNPVVVASLPATASNPGMMRRVSDSTAIAAEGQTCVGGGAVVALAFSTGAAWKCF